MSYRAQLEQAIAELMSYLPAQALQVAYTAGKLRWVCDSVSLGKVVNPTPIYDAVFEEFVVPALKSGINTISDYKRMPRESGQWAYEDGLQIAKESWNKALEEELTQGRRMLAEILEILELEDKL